MKYVIDIDELDYETIKEVDELGGNWKTDIASRNIRAIANGTPLEEVLGDIKAEIEEVKSVMNEEIIEHNRKDLINFVNGLNQCLCIIDKHISGKE